MTAFGAAFLLGLTGSTHCVLMCGPLVSAVQPRHWTGVLIMHTSRLAVYALIGAATGAAGAAITNLGAGRYLAWIVAATLIVQAVASWQGRTGRGPVGRSAGRVISSLGARLRVRTRWSPVLWGVVNGLLPCGMVYSAATLSAGLATPLAGAAAMTAFGLGTVPALVLISRPLSAVVSVFAEKRPWLVPAVLVVLAALVATRGAGFSLQDHNAGSGHPASTVSHPAAVRHATSGHQSAPAPRQ